MDIRVLCVPVTGNPIKRLISTMLSSALAVKHSGVNKGKDVHKQHLFNNQSRKRGRIVDLHHVHYAKDSPNST